MNDEGPVVFDGNRSSVKQAWAKGIIHGNVGQEDKEVTMVIDSQWQRSLVISIKRCS